VNWLLICVSRKKQAVPTEVEVTLRLTVSRPVRLGAIVIVIVIVTVTVTVIVIVIVIVYLFHRSLWLNSAIGCRTCQKTSMRKQLIIQNCHIHIHLVTNLIYKNDHTVNIQ
jgi:hypothetical protein